MTTVATSPPRPSPRYLALFPDWEGRRPVGWYFAEQFLEARAASGSPPTRPGPTRT